MRGSQWGRRKRNDAVHQVVPGAAADDQFPRIHFERRFGAGLPLERDGLARFPHFPGPLVAGRPGDQKGREEDKDQSNSWSPHGSSSHGFHELDTKMSRPGFYSGEGPGLFRLAPDLRDPASPADFPRNGKGLGRNRRFSPEDDRIPPVTEFSAPGASGLPSKARPDSQGFDSMRIRSR